MNSKFDTRVQQLKNDVLREIIKAYDNHVLDSAYIDIPPKIVPGPKANMRCCIYKERAILMERIRMALGGDKSNPNIIEVLPIACEECPMETYFVTPACRGCINHRCIDACPVGAISIVDRHAIIDSSKCIECGKCATACPYHSIIELTRPCVSSCKIGALSIDDDKKAHIDNDKCVMCGACVHSCPFGAIMDKSYILQTLDILHDASISQQHVYAIIAPAIVSQFKYARIEQIVSGIKELGFHQVVETALGADITLYKELEEFHDTMTTSCCPSFVMYIEKHFPALVPYISHAPSPMVEAAKLIKATDSDAKVIFIGPCTSKKYEYQLDKTDGAVDSVISFEELQAFFDARNIDIGSLPDSPLNNASYYGRIFAKSGGISTAIKELAQEKHIDKNIITVSASGLEQCKMALLKLKVKRLEGNFLEGMACEGGCINGALCLHHEKKNIQDVDKYCSDAKEHTIDKSVELYNLANNIGTDKK